MEKYFIDEILEIDCDDKGYLNVKFKLESDEENTYRELETDEYYYWVEENFDEEEEHIEEEWDEVTYGLNEGFNFIHWKDYNHSEETVIEFIKDNYLTKNELPKKVKI